METQTIGAGKFKAQCLKLIDEVHEHGGSITITKHGKPFAQLSPVTQKNPSSLYGRMAGTGVVLEDLVESTGAIWEANE